MKKILYMAVALSVIFSLAGCSKAKEPDFSQPVEGSDTAIVDTNKTEPPVEETGAPIDEGNEKDEPQGLSAENLELTSMTSDTAKSWYADCVSSEYTVKESDDGMLIAETASLTDGGFITISTYCDVYYSTAFTYEDVSDTNVLFNKSVDFIKIYIGRDLTNSETEKLQSGITAAANMDDVVCVDALQFPIYISINDSGYSMVLS